MFQDSQPQPRILDPGKDPRGEHMPDLASGCQPFLCFWTRAGGKWRVTCGPSVQAWFNLWTWVYAAECPAVLGRQGCPQICYVPQEQLPAGDTTSQGRDHPQHIFS